ncbi:putative ATP-dependent protease [Erwinia phage vB_EamM_Desertfox]|uniref:Putative ATP-dependent protease n=3 Tax=Agricanvirus TaxID=1984776 RepID=A0A482IK31_9CAUD|nr:putative ATP-dependent protease [Erwinia phage vB_EamM_Deimos-Minion]YP_009621857.1 putative ATP-dependent protease [Erwinia phage vB_EamM_Desertfox]ANH52219.1 putative ATP-dependent protease [Erwinia phage vB_EamM_Deimos-Minion]AUG86223.1 putative ATP-dependent protease [Erwinia phage vB_EamM_Desertfox]QBP07224.1 putative ATP-dependent protease [Erwinia phage Rebecca]
MSSLTTNEVVEHLDQYVIGQLDAKRAIALAYRERSLKAENSGEGWRYITPSNIMMVGPSGSGKTELAKQLADMTNSPFVKCEITEFTQVGYYGRDVKTILTDLLKEAIRIAPEIWRKENKPKLSKANRDLLALMLKDPETLDAFAKALNITADKCTVPFVEEKLLNGTTLRKLNVRYGWRANPLLAAIDKRADKPEKGEEEPPMEDAAAWTQWYVRTKMNFSKLGYSGTEDSLVKEAARVLEAIPIKDKMEPVLIEVIGETLNEKRKKIIAARGASQPKLIRLLLDEKDYKVLCRKLLETMGSRLWMKLDTIIDIGDALNQSKNPPPDFIVKLVEERGIVFIDEFDKIFLDSRGENVGNMGVVRDLMPYLDGVVTEVSTVNERERGGGLFGERNEKYIINTANILWIASGAFHLAKVSDVPAEILGRLPVHVKLNRLTADDLEKVLIKPHGSIIAGVTLLMSAEGAEFVIDAAAIRAIADLAYECNTVGEDTGARRLKGVCFELFRDMLYGASNLLPDQKKVHFTAEQVMAERERILATVERRKEKPKETDPAQRFAKAMKELGALVNN